MLEMSSCTTECTRFIELKENLLKDLYLDGEYSIATNNITLRDYNNNFIKF